jgi:hypothetical protein
MVLTPSRSSLRIVKFWTVLDQEWTTAFLRDQVTAAQVSAERLEAIARSPWYAVRLRRRLRRELA